MAELRLDQESDRWQLYCQGIKDLLGGRKERQGGVTRTIPYRSVADFPAINSFIDSIVAREAPGAEWETQNTWSALEFVLDSVTANVASDRSLLVSKILLGYIDTPQDYENIPFATPGLSGSSPITFGELRAEYTTSFHESISMRRAYAAPLVKEGGGTADPTALGANKKEMNKVAEALALALAERVVTEVKAAQLSEKSSTVSINSTLKTDTSLVIKPGHKEAERKVVELRGHRFSKKALICLLVGAVVMGIAGIWAVNTFAPSNPGALSETEAKIFYPALDRNDPIDKTALPEAVCTSGSQSSLRSDAHSCALAMEYGPMFDPCFIVEKGLAMCPSTSVEKSEEVVLVVKNSLAEFNNDHAVPVDKSLDQYYPWGLVVRTDKGDISCRVQARDPDSNPAVVYRCGGGIVRYALSPLADADNASFTLAELDHTDDTFFDLNRNTTPWTIKARQSGTNYMSEAPVVTAYF